MRIFRSLQDIDDAARGCATAIGNFDGMHRGHQAALKRARAIADAAGLKLAVLTFEPHPASLFRPDEPPFRITPFALKAERLEKAGVDVLYALPFNWDFASQSYEQFIQNILKNSLQAAHVIVGNDFRFGQLRKGSPQDIEAAGIKTTLIEDVADDNGTRFSSSRVRELLKQGDIEKANAALGWEWEIWGEIVEGDHRGRELGYPTANMNLEDTLHPAYGVYAARAQVQGEKDWLSAAVNIGIRPMFEVKVAQVETHIFDFNRTIYGKILKVKPIARLRGEAKFASVAELIAQMEKDCAQARLILSS